MNHKRSLVSLKDFVTNKLNLNIIKEHTIYRTQFNHTHNEEYFISTNNNDIFVINKIKEDGEKRVTFDPERKSYLTNPEFQVNIFKIIDDSLNCLHIDKIHELLVKNISNFCWLKVIIEHNGMLLEIKTEKVDITKEYIYYSIYPDNFINNIKIIIDSDNKITQETEIQTPSAPKLNTQLEQQNLPIATVVTTSSNI